MLYLGKGYSTYLRAKGEEWPYVCTICPSFEKYHTFKPLQFQIRIDRGYGTNSTGDFNISITTRLMVVP